MTREAAPFEEVNSFTEMFHESVKNSLFGI